MGVLRLGGGVVEAVVGFEADKLDDDPTTWGTFDDANESTSLKCVKAAAHGCPVHAKLTGDGLLVDSHPVGAPTSGLLPDSYAYVECLARKSTSSLKPRPWNGAT